MKLLSLSLLALVAAACGNGTPSPTPTEPAGVGRYSGIVAAAEFVVGPNRFPFGLVSRDGEFLEGAAITVQFFSLNQEPPQLLTEALATWRTIQGTTPHEHAGGDVHLHLDFRGIYVVDEVAIPEAGVWGAQFMGVTASGEPLELEGAGFRVDEQPTAPGVGEPVPRTENLTIHDVATFAELSTRAVEDELHNVSVAQAVEAGEPFVVVFASPQFCVSAMCGPVTDTVEQAREQIGGGIEFIHIEPWDLAAARDEGRLVPAEIMREWRLPSEPWTFVVDGEGRVAKRFEGLVTVEEIVAALRPLPTKTAR